jgi:hypothetical protein
MDNVFLTIFIRKLYIAILILSIAQNTVCFGAISLERTDADTVSLVMSGNTDVAAFDFAIAGMTMLGIECVVAGKEADYNRNKAIVYGINEDIIPDGEVARIQGKVYGSNEVKLIDIHAAKPDGEEAEINTAPCIEINNTRSISRPGSSRTVIRKKL